MISFNENAKDHILKFRGWSQVDFARRLGITPSYFSLIWNEKRTASAQVIEGTLKIFGASADEFSKFFKIQDMKGKYDYEAVGLKR